ncbi:MAG: hypothetical protein ACI9EF_002104 [Pseudohongiellaceae bacterium]|jgi:hypothetical protein
MSEGQWVSLCWGTMKRTDPLLVTCALIPAASLCAFYSYVLRARLALGAWPRPYRPDPKSLGFEIHHDIVVLLLEAASLSPIAFALCALVHQAVPQLRERRMGWAVTIFLASYALWWVGLLLDPGSFHEWFFD